MNTSLVSSSATVHALANDGRRHSPEAAGLSPSSHSAGEISTPGSRMPSSRNVSSFPMLSTSSAASVDEPPLIYTRNFSSASEARAALAKRQKTRIVLNSTSPSDKVLLVLAF